jgi:host factor-I protein
VKASPSPTPSGSLQNRVLEALRRECTPVFVYLLNGIRLQGEIHSFDKFAIVLRGDGAQMIYKRLIATIVPRHEARVPDGTRVPVVTEDKPLPSGTIASGNKLRTLTLSRRKAPSSRP